jgi:hypothetical protein
MFHGAEIQYTLREDRKEHEAAFPKAVLSLTAEAAGAFLPEARPPLAPPSSA